MKINMKVTGLNELKVAMRHAAGTVPDAARKQMHRGSDRIVANAKKMAPVDRHNLEESIRKEKSYGDRGRLQIDIMAGGTVNGVDVDQYAVIMHESDYSLGKASRAKQAGQSEIVGPKFLERAAMQEAKHMQGYVKKSVFSTLSAIFKGLVRSITG